jgi:hypothetical protein
MKLRTAAIFLSLLVTVAGVIANWAGCHATSVVVGGPVIFVSLLVERWRYNAAHRAQSGDAPTGERFIDPESGDLMEVVYNKRTGERRYVRVNDKGRS